MTLPDPSVWPVDDPPSGDSDLRAGDSGPRTDESWTLDGESLDLLRERADSTPEATALIITDDDVAWSYREFDRRVDDWCAGLQGNLAVEGSRIGLLLSTGIEFATLFAATVRRNGVVAPLNVRESTSSLEPQARRAGLDAVICEAETEEAAVRIAPADAAVLSVDEPTASGVRRLDPTPGATVDGIPASRDTDRIVLFTSGTTGDPKGVRLTRGNLVASAVGSAHRLGVEPRDRWLVCLPMYHMGGLAPFVRSTLYGTTTVLQPTFDPEATATAMREKSVTGVSLVPTMLSRLLDAEWNPPQSLRFVLLGGAPARPALIERCHKADVPVFPTYGTTETASQITTATPAEAFDDPETVGRPLRGTSVSVISDGASRETDETGELVVDGPTVTSGYLDADQTAAAFDDAGFHTGDLGYRDSDGRFFVVGRVDDRIVTGGENVHPAAVAGTLRSHESVDDAVVVGLPDEDWGERVAALVVPTSADCSGEALIEDVGDTLADFAVPKSLRFVEALPRTASGTADRERVRELLAEPDWRE